MIMDKMNVDTLLAEMDLRFKHFLFARSLTPYIAEKEWDKNAHDGVQDINTATLYMAWGFNSQIHLDLDNVSYEDWRDAGAWTNKSFIISIFALLDHWGVVDYIRTTLKLTEGVDKDYWSLLCNLRNTLAHSSECFPIQKGRTSENFTETIRLQKKLFPALLKDESKPNLDIQKFIIPFYLKLREILDNQLSQFKEFWINEKGKLEGVLVTR